MIYNLVARKFSRGGAFISTNDNKKLNPLEQLGFSLNICIVFFAVVLTMFMRFHSTITSKLQGTAFFEGFPQAEIADRLSVLILLLLCLIGFFALPIVTLRFNNDISVKMISFVALALITLTVSWRWGDPTFLEYGTVLWFGWGDKFALLTLLIALLLTYFVSSHLYKMRDSDRSNLVRLMNAGSYVVLLCYYLPSAIQPFKGIIDPYHSRYVLNDLLIVASGKMPYSEIVPAYVGVLGWPLKLISFLPNELIVNSALAWVNLLVLIEVACIAYLTKKSLDIKYWGLAILIPVATIYVKVQPNIHSLEDATYRRAWGSIAQFMSMIPGRSVLPIVLLTLVARLAANNRGHKKSVLGFFAGAFIVITAFNNVEFGVPASIAATIVLFFVARLSLITRNDLFKILIGAISTSVLIIIAYSASDTKLVARDWLAMSKAHGLDSFANEAMPIFGLWVFFYAIFGASAIIGSIKLSRTFKLSIPSTRETYSAIILSFGGLWGSATLFYFSGGSMVPRLTPSLIPLTLCIAGLGGLLCAQINLALDDKSESFKNGNFKIVLAPIFCLLLIPVISLTQTPNPSFEWLRMAGAGDKWSSREIGRMEKYQDLIELRDQESDYKYVYMGNDGTAISMMSGVENGLGIILVKDLLIGEELRELGCRPALNSGADFALVPKIDWDIKEIPCPGFIKFEPKKDSPFLFFRIPSKVAP